MEIDKARIEAAIREHIAAQNSYARSCEELQAAIPPGIYVLQRYRAGEDRFITWENGAPRESVMIGGETTATPALPHGCKEAIILDDLLPKGTFLPRLEDSRR